jgi:hypothetical protein
MDATMWATTPDGYGGHSVTNPVHIKCRWVDRNEEFINPLNQREEVSRAVVYVDRSVKVNDWLTKGHVDNLDPAALDVAYQVRRYDEIPDLRSLYMVRKVYL